jgi:hypothetical protein
LFLGVVEQVRAWRGEKMKGGVLGVNLTVRARRSGDMPTVFFGATDGTEFFVVKEGDINTFLWHHKRKVFVTLGCKCGGLEKRQGQYDLHIDQSSRWPNADHYADLSLMFWIFSSLGKKEPEQLDSDRLTFLLSHYPSVTDNDSRNRLRFMRAELSYDRLNWTEFKRNTVGCALAHLLFFRIIEQAIRNAKGDLRRSMQRRLVRNAHALPLAVVANLKRPLFPMRVAELFNRN